MLLAYRKLIEIRAIVFSLKQVASVMVSLNTIRDPVAHTT